MITAGSNLPSRTTRRWRLSLAASKGPYFSSFALCSAVACRCYLYTHMHTDTQTHTHAHGHTHTHTQTGTATSLFDLGSVSSSLPFSSLLFHVCGCLLYLCAYTHTHARTHAHKHIHTRTHALTWYRFPALSLSFSSFLFLISTSVSVFACIQQVHVLYVSSVMRLCPPFELLSLSLSLSLSPDSSRSHTNASRSHTNALSASLLRAVAAQSPPWSSWTAAERCWAAAVARAPTTGCAMTLGTLHRALGCAFFFSGTVHSRPLTHTHAHTHTLLSLSMQLCGMDLCIERLHKLVEDAKADAGLAKDEPLSALVSVSLSTHRQRRAVPATSHNQTAAPSPPRSFSALLACCASLPSARPCCLPSCRAAR